MASYRSTKTSRSGFPPISAGFSRSMSPPGRVFTARSLPGPPPSSSSSSFFSSTSSSFLIPSPSSFHEFHHQSASPTRVNLVGSVAPHPSVRFSVAPPSRESHVMRRNPSIENRQKTHKRRTCMCSPTTHPGSFRCALHKNTGFHHGKGVSAPSHRLNARRSAMTNSLVRIGTVEGDLVRRSLSALIRPSSHQQRRRGSFQLRPSRLSTMSKAGDDDLS